MLYKNTIESNTLELLIELQKEETLKNFHLVGGTALALQLGHRRSIDLDFFSQEGFALNEMLEFLEEKYEFRLNYSSKNTLKGSIKGIKIDILTHKYALVNPPIFTENINLLSVEDIAAMKLNAITGNGTRSKDVIDVYFILKQFSIKDILSFYAIKYNSRNNLHVIKSLNYFEEINISDWPEMILEKELELTKVKNTIQKQIKEFSDNL
ncbi:MAG: nucleotidyl transferase AbiEii/AbiGii toxin family protein [Bacteroidales bacterium]|nr:nucleotidyl transferase AbiEii/AbiGii toxin family protein [Bacteroidales bacterium]